jgi:hypothetical protein
MSSKLLLALLLSSAVARIVDFEKDGGAVPDTTDLATAWKNGGIMNSTLNALQPGDMLIIPNKTYHLMGGITAPNLKDVVISFDGTIEFSDDIKAWPRNGKHVLECFHFQDPINVTFTSSGLGTINGKGGKWWGIPGIGYLVHQENRPRLISADNAKGCLFENIILKDSPYWTFWFSNTDGLEVRNAHIDARRLNDDGHDIIDITAFNTDGFDVSGKNVWIHDCTVWNDDDSVCVKDGSENMLFERINASGLGLTIGSIGSSTVRNITFRDIYMHHTYKGIYMKFRGGGGGHVSDVLYENIWMEEPSQAPIWIGPAQQSDSDNLCAAHPCSICWPTLPGAKCNAADSLYSNITLRNITINNPKQSPGVILGSTNASWSMKDILFDSVVVNHPGKKPFDSTYLCQGVGTGRATGGTSPVPSCFKDETDAAKRRSV